MIRKFWDAGGFDGILCLMLMLSGALATKKVAMTGAGTLDVVWCMLMACLFAFGAGLKLMWFLADRRIRQFVEEEQKTGDR